MISPIRAAATRRTETPIATMTTLASPTLGGSAGLSLWQVEMSPQVQGPLHAFDSEQLWSVLDGAVAIAVDGETVELGAGDTLVLPAGVERQVTATTAARLVVCGHADAVATVPGEDVARGTPAWIA